MFFHNLKYMFIILFKNKALIFWTFAFPIFLGTFFYMAFQNIEASEQFHPIHVAVVENEELNQNLYWKEALKTISDEESDNNLFDIRYSKEDEARELLENDEIIGYLILKETPKIIIKKNGINQTIFKSIVEQIREGEKLQKELLNIDYRIQNEGEKQLNIVDISNRHLSYTMIEFYTLIAMTALYGGLLGMYAMNQVLANMSSNGKRITISPICKRKLVLSSVLASYVTQLIGMLLLFLYTIFVLKVDYGNQFHWIVLLALVGCLAGLTLGIMVACLFKTNENTKTGIMIALTMLGCFLSGMMGVTMKYLVDKNIPVLNKINPASMITDGFYALYYYNTLDRFWLNVICLLVFSLIMITLSMIHLRRQKYDSI